MHIVVIPFECNSACIETWNSYVGKSRQIEGFLNFGLHPDYERGPSQGKGMGVALRMRNLFSRLSCTYNLCLFIRLQDLNKHLDDLTEHYDIPKVSWTK